MARRQRVDRHFSLKLDEIEQKIHRLKIQYDKYFLGLEAIEPLREREELRRDFRELTQDPPVVNAAQRYRLQVLRARMGAIEQYINRNLHLLERGMHPKANFRAGLAERRRSERDDVRDRATRVQRQREQEEAAYRKVFDLYLEARRRCGQTADVSFDSVREVLHNQVRTIKSRYQCESVTFRVTVEEGKARLKAVPRRAPVAGAAAPPTE